jgi:hypothetical protein
MGDNAEPKTWATALNKFVFAASSGGKSVGSYLCDPANNAFKMIMAAQTGTTLYKMVVDATGKFLYGVQNTSTNNIWGWTINSTTGKAIDSS